MKKRFKRTAIISRHQEQAAIGETLSHLIDFLDKKRISIVLEEQTAHLLKSPQHEAIKAEQLGWHCDLIIAVGGDGSLLHAAQIAAAQKLPIVGVNRGRLGFLTDIKPELLEEQLTEILDGNYIPEKRFLLTIVDNNALSLGDSINEVVIASPSSSHMIEFDIFIDGNFVYRERSDGLIVATPTGSTAYALSAGGPILTPQLDVMVLVSMFPHKLTSRPIAIDANQKIEILMSEQNSVIANIMCDGNGVASVKPGERIQIYKKREALTLIHPQDYNYYKALRTKLNWNIHKLNN